MIGCGGTASVGRCSMQRVLRYLAALTILVMIGATVATVDAAPGKSISGFVTGQGKGNGNGGGNGHGNGNGNGNGRASNQSDENEDEDDGKKDKKDKKDKSSKSSKSKHDDGTPEGDDDDDRKVKVCHVTGSESNPGHVIEVSK